jgi:aminocarboxymuconate-semialdehyde decarboxylase
MSRVVDLHAHVVLEAAFGAAGSYGPSLEIEDGHETFRVGSYRMRVPYRDSVFMNLGQRLAGMDRMGIDQQLLSPNPLTFFGGIEPQPAVDFARATNEAMATMVGRHPDRLLGAAALPLQDPQAACAELQRAICELGLVAAYVGTDYGFAFDDRRLDDVYATLVQLDVPLFVHPATNDGVGPASDKRLRRFGLDLIVGYTYEETLTAAAIVLGGVLHRHPEVDICISHGGGAIAYLARRFDTMAEFQGRESDFAAGLRRLWFDAHMDDGPARDLVVSVVGSDRMVYGTNFGGWDAPRSTNGFDASLTPNAQRLLRLP